MMKAALKRLIPIRARAPLRGAYERARGALIDSATLRQAAQIRSRLTKRDEHRPLVVFFAPEAAVTLYLQTEIALARALRSQGCDVVFTRCFEMLPRCPVKDMLLLPFDLPPERARQTCLQCYRDSKRLLEDGSDLDFVDLREIVGPDARARIESAMGTLPAEELDFEYDGINVGALAFYDFAISHKHPIHAAMSAPARDAWKQYVRNAMTAIEMTRGLVERFRPTALVCFDEYAMMSAARLYAKRSGVTVRMISVAYHLNGDWRRPVAMSNLTVVKDFELRLAQWPRWRDVPLTTALVASAVDDTIHRLTRTGSHIYSPSKTVDTSDLRARLRLDPTRRVLVAYTSSTDEHDALLVNLRGLGIEPQPVRDAFADTFEWLHALIRHVEASDHLQLIVRVHPRVGATPRDNRPAAEYQRYLAEFSGSYRYTRFVWPEEPVSSFDLAEFADLALISWSSIGLELARLGVPVLSGNRSMMVIGPGEEFIEHATTQAGYFETIKRLIGGFKDPGEQLRLCFRWYHLLNLGNSIDFGDVVDLQGRYADAATARRAGLAKNAILGTSDAMTANIAELEAASTLHSRQEETAALRGQIGRLMHFLCTGQDAGGLVDLRRCGAAELGSAAQRGRFSIEADDVSYDQGARLWRRRSRLAARLGEIFESLS
jgi:hypothetical protein